MSHRRPFLTASSMVILRAIGECDFRVTASRKLSLPRHVLSSLVARESGLQQAQPMAYLYSRPRSRTRVFGEPMEVISWDVGEVGEHLLVWLLREKG